MQSQNSAGQNLENVPLQPSKQPREVEMKKSTGRSLMRKHGESGAPDIAESAELGGGRMVRFCQPEVVPP